MIGLTLKQRRALMFVAGFIEAKGYGPKFRSIMAGVGSTSFGTVHGCLTSLEERGYIRKLRYRRRAIEIVHPVSIPRDPEGQPLFWVGVP